MFADLRSLLLTAVFALGFMLLYWPLASRIRFSRMSRLALLTQKHRRKRRAAPELAHDPFAGKRQKERIYMERARIAGLGPEWSYRRFRMLQGGVAAMLGLIALLFLESRVGAGYPGLTLPFLRNLTILMTVAASLGWGLPAWFLMAFAAQAHSRYLAEIAKLSGRLALCVSEHADTRDILLRAGRTLPLLGPHIQELAAMWSKNQQAAIWRFKEAIGISEVFPLVNALYAISRAEGKDVVKVLIEQTKSIDATLESDVNRRIENAPLWISFYIMIPFTFVVVLFLYPWVITISNQLMNVY